nr:phage portal protein [Demequina sp. TTPB684]
MRGAYYDGKRAARQITSVLPPAYNNLGLVLGWTAKAVDALNRRCHLDTFTWPDGDLGSLGFAEVWDGNMLGAEVDQGLESSLVHCTGYTITTAGGPGEPEVLWQFRDATQAIGDWNARTRRLDNLLVVTSYADSRLTGFVLYEPNRTITCRREQGKWLVVADQEHVWGVPAEPLPYKPRLRRPFGSSRITRPMMGLQDAAVRELARLEGHMDVYSFPEMWMLGADPSIFKAPDGTVRSTWQVMLGRIKGIPDDEDLTNPRADVKQFLASSPEPHLKDINALSKLFAREASLPDSSVAISDFANPTSAESYDASQYELVAEAEGATDDWSPFLRRSMIRALAMQNGINGMEDVPAEWWSINTSWRDVRYESRAAKADGGMKQLQALPWLAETEVGPELVGLTPDQARRAEGDRRRKAGSATLQAIAAGGSGSAAEEAKTIAAKGEALGSLIRAGVIPADAARIVGLDVGFTGAVPVTLRPTEREAANLEGE